MWEYDSGFHSGNQHDSIQRHLSRELKRYSKRHLEGVSWTGSVRNNDHLDDSVFQSERMLSGDLPSGKSYCRADVALSVGDVNYAFEIKTSASDAKNWPEQARDYLAKDYIPILIVTPEVVVDLAPGHRLVTDSEHAYASDHELYFQSDKLPQTLVNRFGAGSPIGDLLDRCPDCGYKLEYRKLMEQVHHCCSACGWCQG